MTGKSDSDTKLQGIAKALTLAEASDGTDVDTRIAEFVTKRARILARRQGRSSSARFSRPATIR